MKSIRKENEFDKKKIPKVDPKVLSGPGERDNLPSTNDKPNTKLIDSKKH